MRWTPGISAGDRHSFLRPRSFLLSLRVRRHILDVRVRELRAEMHAILPHHRADDFFRGLEDELLRQLDVALVRHVDRELVPDERRVFRIVEDVPLHDLAVRDGHVAARETVAAQDAAELAEGRVHRRDVDDVASGVVHLDPVPEFVESHRDEHDPAHQVQQRLLHDVDQRRGHEGGSEEAKLLGAPANHDEKDKADHGRPDRVGHKLEVREDVCLVSDVGLERRAEDRPQDHEERLRRDEKRNDEDPWFERRHESGRALGQTRYLKIPVKNEKEDECDRRYADPEEGSRSPPIGDLHRHLRPPHALFNPGDEVIRDERRAPSVHGTPSRGPLRESSGCRQMNSANLATSSGRVSLRTFRIARTLSLWTPTFARISMMSSNSLSARVTSLFFASQLRYRFSSSFARQPFSYSIRAASL